MCKERDFSLLHHFRHRTGTKHRSWHFNHANPFPVYFHFRFLQINANTSHTHLIVVLHCYPSILANTCRNAYFSQCNLVSRLYVPVLRSVRNLHLHGSFGTQHVSPVFGKPHIRLDKLPTQAAGSLHMWYFVDATLPPSIKLHVNSLRLYEAWWPLPLILS